MFKSRSCKPLLKKYFSIASAGWILKSIAILLKFLIYDTKKHLNLALERLYVQKLNCYEIKCKILLNFCKWNYIQKKWLLCICGLQFRPQRGFPAPVCLLNAGCPEVRKQDKDAS